MIYPPQADLVQHALHQTALVQSCAAAGERWPLGRREPSTLMAFPFGLVEGDKFAILALTNVGATVAGPDVLADGTVVSAGIPDEMIDDFWQASLGSIAVEALHRCNLTLVRRRASTTPGVLDAEHRELGERLVEVFWLLQLSGVPYYEGATILKGSIESGIVNVRAHDNLTAHQFLASNGAAITHVTMSRLNQAAQQALAWRAMLEQEGQHARFKRGLNILLDGLQEHYGQERLHAFVRALEALVLPATGKTKKQFVYRCQTFATSSASSAVVLGECFDMRSLVEHVNDPDACLSSYAVTQREAVALRRVRQVEALARFTYERLLGHQDLAQHFQSEPDIASFWKLPSSERQTLWGSQLDPESVP